MGKAEDWRTTIQNMLLGFNVVIYNPRRDDWDASWIQSVNNEKFVEQVSWELEHINKCVLSLCILTHLLSLLYRYWSWAS